MPLEAMQPLASHYRPPCHRLFLAAGPHQAPIGGKRDWRQGYGQLDREMRAVLSGWDRCAASSLLPVCREVRVVLPGLDRCAASEHQQNENKDCYFYTLTPFGSVHLAHLHHHNFAETLGKPF